MNVALEEKIKNKVESIAAIADSFPGVIAIHTTALAMVYMSPTGLRQLGVKLSDLQGMNNEKYHEKYFNPDDAKDYVPKLLNLMERNSDETVSFFQQVRINGQDDWTWHISSMKILMRDDEGKPLLLITFAFPVDPMTHVTAKVSRLLEENTFLRTHYPEFSKLGKREKDVLKLLALGKSSAKIAEELFISVATVETHRKNIKNKLKANSSFDLAQYARAFDLI
jgi:DNA-binding CsgD family transcriptional regulator